MTDAKFDQEVPAEQEEAILLELFGESVKNTAYDKTKIEETICIIQSVNPDFSWSEEYSEDAEINLIANIVEGIYAPLITAYAYTIVQNVKEGVLPPNLYIPPRDGYPLIGAIRVIAQSLDVNVNIIPIPVSRAMAGIENNQEDEEAVKDPLLPEYLAQELGCIDGDLIVEVETGIYGTLTLKLSEVFEKANIEKQIIPLKMYGLGPTLSFFRAMFDSGNWYADSGSESFDPNMNKWWMIILDSIEEYGMSNLHQTVKTLQKGPDGKVLPVYLPVEERTLDIAKATNWAVILHAQKSVESKENPLEVARMILLNVPKLTAAAKGGIPVIFEAAIKSMSNRDKHFRNLVERVKNHSGPGKINHDIAKALIIEA